MEIAMANCPNFKQTRVNGPVMHPIGGARSQSSTLVNWCSHSATPAQERIALTTIGGDKLLTCGGDLARCQIPQHKR